MKRILALVFVGVIGIGAAGAGDVTIKVTMSDEIEGDAVSTFTPATEKIYANFKTNGVKRDDKLRGVLIAEDVGDAAPANTKVLETNIDMEGDTEDGDFNFSKPTNGWPVGQYRVDVFLNDQLVTTAKFTVKVAGTKKKSTSEEEESGD